MSEILFEKYLLHDLTEEESDKLAGLLKEDSAAAVRFTEFLQEWTLTAEISHQMSVTRLSSGSSGRIQRKRKTGTFRRKKSAVSVFINIGIAACIALITGILFFHINRSETVPQPFLADLTVSSGNVTVLRDGSTIESGGKTGLYRGDRISTGRGDSADIVFPGGLTGLYLDSETSLRLDESNGIKLIDLEKGNISCYAGGKPENRRMTVATAHASASITGTRFNVNISDESTLLLVTEGSVSFTRSSDNRSVSVPEGYKCTADMNPLSEFKPEPIHPLEPEAVPEPEPEPEPVLEPKPEPQPVLPPKPDPAPVPKPEPVPLTPKDKSLIALYEFNEEKGIQVLDTSGYGTPLNLTIQNPEEVRRGEGVLTVTGQTQIASSGPASKITAACRKSGELTVEVWIRPRGGVTSVEHKYPWRIVTLSGNPWRRNFTLGQGITKGPHKVFGLRVRTSDGNLDGAPSTHSVSGITFGNVYHVAAVHTKDGRVYLFVNGKQVSVRLQETSKSLPFVKREGDFSNWDPSFRLALGDEFNIKPGDGTRQWFGDYYKVAIYSRALSSAEVAKKYKKGY